MSTVQHTVTNKGHSEIGVLMADGWHKLGHGDSVTGVLLAVNNGRARAQYSVEPFDGAHGQTEDTK